MTEAQLEQLNIRLKELEKANKDKDTQIERLRRDIKSLKEDIRVLNNRTYGMNWR